MWFVRHAVESLQVRSIFLVFFHVAAEGSMQRGGADRDREPEKVGWRKRETFRLFSFSFTVVSLQLHAFRQVGSIDEDQSFSRCINVCLFFVVIFLLRRRCGGVWC